LFSAEPGQVVVTFQEVMPTFTDGIGQAARAPSFFMCYFAFPAGDKFFDAAPCIGRLLLIQHWAQDYDNFVMTQKVLLLNFQLARL
jgi:hypothetical protein